MSERFTASGKQVLHDGEHFADACSPAAAEAIVIMLNKAVLLSGSVTDGEVDIVTRELWS